MIRFIREMQTFERVVVGLIAAIVLALVVAISYGAWLEIAHPCRKQANCRPETYYVKSRNVMVPMTHTVCDCVEREP
jgi:hypothetical protein